MLSIPPFFEHPSCTSPSGRNISMETTALALRKQCGGGTDWPTDSLLQRVVPWWGRVLLLPGAVGATFPGEESWGAEPVLGCARQSHTRACHTRCVLGTAWLFPCTGDTAGSGGAKDSFRLHYNVGFIFIILRFHIVSVILHRTQLVPKVLQHQKVCGVFGSVFLYFTRSGII